MSLGEAYFIGRYKRELKSLLHEAFYFRNPSNLFHDEFLAKINPKAKMKFDKSNNEFIDWYVNKLSVVNRLWKKGNTEALSKWSSLVFYLVNRIGHFAFKYDPVLNWLGYMARSASNTDLNQESRRFAKRKIQELYNLATPNIREQKPKFDLSLVAEFDAIKAEFQNKMKRKYSNSNARIADVKEVLDSFGIKTEHLFYKFDQEDNTQRAYLTLSIKYGCGPDNIKKHLGKLKKLKREFDRFTQKVIASDKRLQK